MQIIRDKSTHRAVLMFPSDAPLQLGASGLQAPGLTVTDLSDATHEVVAALAPVPPLYWVAGALAYDGAAWSVHDQATYDAFSVAAQADYERKAAAEMAAAVEKFDAALTAHLDATAQARRYDNRITCALRAGYTGPFQAEGQAFASWMDTCNAMAYTLLAEVQAGTRPLPATTQALIDTLPAMEWPT